MARSATRRGYNVGATTRTPVIADIDGDGNADIAVALGIASSERLSRFCAATVRAASRQRTVSGVGVADPTMQFIGAANSERRQQARPRAGLAGHAEQLHACCSISRRRDRSRSARRRSPQATNVPTVVLADFDGDSDIDLAAGVVGAEHACRCILNDGNGGFPRSGRSAAPGTFSSTVTRVRDVGDLNGDGRIDLGVKLNDGSFQVLLRNPAGGFNAPVVVTPPDARLCARSTPGGSAAPTSTATASPISRGSCSRPDRRSRP